MTSNKNFMDQPTPSIIDTEYERCNFRQKVPVTVGALKRGVRLFPGDDTPRTFTQCNMVNCEPPPGSTLVGCNTTIVEYDVVMSTDTVTVDGQQVSLDHHSHLVHGRFDPSTEGYVDLPSVQEQVED